MEAFLEFLCSPVGISVVLGLAVIWFYKYSTKGYSVWEERGIPYAKPKPLFGSLLGRVKKPFHDTEVERYQKLGRIYGHYLGRYVLLSVGDPKLLRSILVKDFHIFMDRRTLKTGDAVAESMIQFLEGEDWKRIRTIVTPTFTTGKIKRMMGVFTSCSDVLVKNFREYAEKEQPFEAKKIYAAFTMDVIASAAFSTKLDSHNDPNNEFVRVAREGFQSINYRYLFYLIFPWLMRLFKVPVFPPNKVKFFSKLIHQIMEERQRTGQSRNDFLQLLMDIAQEQGEQEKSPSPEAPNDIMSNYGGGEANDQVFKNLQSSKKTLSFNELVAQCVIFFIAGFSTTANTLAFATYYLALNTEIQDKLFEEVKEAIKEYDGKLTYEAVQGMKYLDNVISETMRLSPPATRLERVANEEYKLGDTGYTIPKGTVVTIPIYAMHRDEEFFPDPDKFDPNRFTPEEQAKRDPYTYMPFGAGPRNCLGMRFALVELKVCLAYVISHFRIKRCPETKVPLDYYVGEGNLQPKDIMVQMELRKDCPLKE